MQDAIAIAIAVVVAAWLVRSLVARCFAAPCQPPSAGGPAGSDGFVPLETLSRNNAAPERVRRRGS